jgi:hypothetical protein
MTPDTETIYIIAPKGTKGMLMAEKKRQGDHGKLGPWLIRMVKLGAGLDDAQPMTMHHNRDWSK